MIRLLFTMLLLAALCGCQQEGTTTSEPIKGSTEKQPSARTHLSLDRTTTPISPEQEFRIELAPEEITGTEDVTVRLFGCLNETSYTWQVNGVTIETASIQRLGHHQFSRDDLVSVTVNCGGQNLTISQTVLNTPPRISRVQFDNPEIVSGADISVTPEATDPDGDAVQFRYLWSINGEEQFDISSATLPGDRVKTGSEITLNVIPADDLAEGEPYLGAIFTIPNAPPRFVSQPPADFKTDVYSYAIKGHDPDGDPLTYQLESAPEGMLLDSETGLLNWPLAGVEAGEYQIVIVISDPEQQQARQEYTLKLGSQE